MHSPVVEYAKRTQRYNELSLRILSAAKGVYIRPISVEKNDVAVMFEPIGLGFQLKHASCHTSDPLYMVANAIGFIYGGGNEGHTSLSLLESFAKDYAHLGVIHDPDAADNIMFDEDGALQKAANWFMDLYRHQSVVFNTHEDVEMNFRLDREELIGRFQAYRKMFELVGATIYITP